MFNRFVKKLNKMNCYVIFLFSLINFNNIIFDFNKEVSLSGWRIIDDVVMGGVSEGKFKIVNEGNGVFYGNVSLENNGGFSSIRYNFNKIDVKKFNKIVLKVKGDGKNYQFRVKSNINEYHSYKYEFKTNNTWQNIEIQFNQLEPTFRGRMLNMPSFSNVTLQEICFLISNKIEEDFSLEIDYVKIQ